MSIFDLVKNRVQILDVIQEYTTLKRTGSSYWKGCCPFHHEKTASFTVSPHKEIFYCFGCHAHGDVISFIARAEQCSQIEAAKHIAERYGIEIPKEEGAALQGSTTQERDHYYTISSTVAQWAHEQLLKNKHAYEYLHKRGITESSITQYLIGYFPGGTAAIKSLVAYAKQKSLLSKDLFDTHIISEGQAAPYSSFEERILFPIRDHLGRICGFGGRILRSDDTRSKYYNTRENEFFSKGSLLFGLDSAKTAIQESETVFLVEGYTDCIAMVQAGFVNTVATLGTACTPHHLKQVSRYAHTMYVIYDSDRAGREAVLRLTTLCWQVNMELKIVTLPSGLDPASFCASGGDMNSLIAVAQDLFVFYINDIGSSFATKPLARKLEGIRGLVEAIAGVDDALKRDLLLQDASQKLTIRFEILKQEVQRIFSGKPVESQKAPAHGAEQLSDTTQLQVLEKALVCAILNNTDALCEQKAHYLGTYLSRPFGDIVRRLFYSKKTVIGDCFRAFFASLNPEQQRYISELTLAQGDAYEEQFSVLYEQWKRRQWKVIVADMKTKIAQAHNENDQERAAALLEEFALLKKEMVLSVSGIQKEQ
jgi:DNA primase